MRRSLLMLTGLLVAGVGALAFLAFALMVEGLAMRADTLVSLLASMVTAAAMAGQDGLGSVLAQGLAVVWAAVVALCFAPVAIAAMVGELGRFRSFAWYGGASGIGAAAGPTVARLVLFGQAPLPPFAGGAEGRLTLIFFLTGTVAGCVYWLVAGRSAGAAR